MGDIYFDSFLPLISLDTFQQCESALRLFSSPVIALSTLMNSFLISRLIEEVPLPKVISITVIVHLIREL